jgi:hypothetical protein
MHSTSIVRDARTLLESARPSDVQILRTPTTAIIVVAFAASNGNELPTLLSLDEAAAAAHVGVRALREAIRSGKLEASGTSRTRVIAREALLAWVESRRVRVTSADDVLAARADEIARAG